MSGSGPLARLRLPGDTDPAQPGGGRSGRRGLPQGRQAHPRGAVLGGRGRRQRGELPGGGHVRRSLPAQPQRPSGLWSTTARRWTSWTSTGWRPRERVRALTGIGMDLAVLGRTAEAQASLEETVRLSRRWSLKHSLAASLFYLGWLHALAGREHDAARCLTECHADRRGARARPLLQPGSEGGGADPGAVRPSGGRARSSRKEIIPLLPARLAAYFEELAKGKTYPTDVPLGPPRAGASRAGCPHRRPGTRSTPPPWKASKP